MQSEDLAGFLRELKERSGLSYGTLAKRLHMSPSTVHRYCNSDAVPTDFAPVEKIARLCGAQREELLRLHRLWIVADETRRRARTAAPQPAAEKPPSSSERSTEPTEPTEPTETDPQQDQEQAQEQEQAQAQKLNSEPAPTPDPESVRDEAAPESQEPSTDPASRRRRLLWPVAAAAAMVVAAAIGTAVVWTNTHDTSRAGEQPAVGPVAPSSAARTPGGTAAGDEKPSRTTPGTPTSGGPSTGTDTDAPGGGAGGRTDGAGDESLEVPLAASVNPYVWKDPCSQFYVVDQAPTVVPPPPSQQGARGWVTALDGVPGGEMVIDVSLQGLGDDTVVLKALHVRTVDTSEPLRGNVYAMGVGCGGDARMQSLDINLDAARPRPVPVAGWKGDEYVPASDFPYKVSASDPQVLTITAHTRGRSVRWYLELEWSSGDRSGVLRVDDRGKPFTTSATANRPTYQFPLGASAWEPYQFG
ncbi:helix-turn-helix domain-containing protein [Streptomyces sp. NBC_01353]|uniref:helix-turn-helix domain-containing protein n=1 Tax=Streptomyces sp. NBC_01353 TaxID=2903835 RepID=UPI002E3718BA|nr:helix-turn-helix transcriptional regulator [Streptomyces sp. NBC_01353]